MEMENLKRVLVTGASGFVGSYLIDHLLSLGRDVAGYDLQVSARNDIPFYQGDIYGGSELAGAIKDFQPDVIFHLAGILKSEKPETFYNVHVLGTMTLFEAIVQVGARPVVVVASSSSVYGSGSGKRSLTES